MITIDIDKNQIRQLKKAIDGVKTSITRELRVAVNAAARKTKTIVSRNVRSELAVTAREVNKLITVTVRSTGNYPTATIRLRKSQRLSLKGFSPRQTKKGTSYRISKTEGRKTVAGAFRGPRPGVIAQRLGGHVYKRLGKSRKPIVKMHGPSPWGTFKVKNMKLPTEQESRSELRKQIERRIRFRTLKKAGKI